MGCFHDTRITTRPAHPIAMLAAMSVLLPANLYGQDTVASTADKSPTKASTLSPEELRLLMDQIHLTRMTLNEKIDAQKYLPIRIAGTGRLVGEWPAPPAKLDPEIAETADRLRQLVAHLEASGGVPDRHSEQAFQVRCAKGMMAIAGGDYKAALATVSDADIVVEVSDIDVEVEREVDVLYVLGDAAFGMHDWHEALTRWDRLYELRSAVPDLYFGQATAMTNADSYVEALKRYNQLVKNYVRLVEKENELDFQPQFAKALNNRATILQIQQNLPQAMSDIDKAIDVYGKLTAGTQHAELLPELGIALTNRAILLNRANLWRDAARDADLAVKQFIAAANGPQGDIWSHQLAWALNTRGLARLNLGQISDAYADLDKSAAHRQAKHAQINTKESAQDLAEVLMNRGASLAAQGRLSEGVKDFVTAADLLTRLVDDAGMTMLVADLASAWTNVGMAKAQMGDVDGAAEALDHAITRRRKQIDNQPSSTQYGLLADALFRHGKVLVALDRNGAAAENFEEAGRVYQMLLTESPDNIDLQVRLASAFNAQGLAMSNSGDVLEGLKTLDRAARAWRKVIDAGRPENEAEFAGVCNNRAIALKRLGQQVEAVKEYTRSIQYRQRFWTELKQPENGAELARCYHNRAISQVDMGNLVEAIEDLSKALDIRTDLVEKYNMESVRPELDKTHEDLNILIQVKAERDAPPPPPETADEVEASEPVELEPIEEPK